MSVRIAICHENVRVGDAVGHDICGMAETLRELGVKPVIVGKNIAAPVRKNYPTRESLEGLELSDVDALVYHHSVYWKDGLSLLERFSGPVVFKYHNITPASFFESFSHLHSECCRKGRDQTRDLIRLKQDALWLADSEYNLQELLREKKFPRQTEVVPPFHRHEFCPRNSRPSLIGKGVPRFLFVGRLAPNKGHKTLVRIFDAYLNRISPNALLEIVGGSDQNLLKYKEETIALAESLGVAERILWREHLSDTDLKNAYLDADVFLCTSEHEGFCVPLIEAQCVGLPVVAARAGAVEETLGPEQLIDDYPRSDEDFLFYAKILQEVLCNAEFRATVVEQGYRNFRDCFSRELIGDRFVDSILSLLHSLDT